jgi:heme-degrading monooxygenase HmoA
LNQTKSRQNRDKKQKFKRENIAQMNQQKVTLPFFDESFSSWVESHLLSADIQGGLMPTISKDNKVATLINVFTVEPGNQQKVVDLLVDTTEKLMKHIPGFVSASIHKSLDGVRVVNYAQWRSKEDFEAMRNSPEAQKHMKPFFEIAKVDFHLYEVADAIEARGASA